MAISGTIALKSFQSYMVNDGLLEKVVETVKAGEKEARSTGDIQTFEVFYKGFRQNICIGRVMVIPAKVADSRENFPIALLYGTLLREFGGEEMADLLNYKIGDTEFDEYSKADLAAIKDKIFKNSEGKFESLVMFAPSWWNKREYVTFKFTKDDEKLSNLIRHLVFAAYFDPALSSAFNALMTDVSTDKLDVTNVTPKLNFPGVAENPLKDYPDMQKMGAGRKKIFLTKKTATAIEQSQLEPAELNVFEELNKVVERGLGVTEPIADVAVHNAAYKVVQKSEKHFNVEKDGTPVVEGLPSGKDAQDWIKKQPKQACGELVVVQGTNVGPGTAAQEQAPPVVGDTKAPEGAEPLGIELDADGTPAREETGKKAAEECDKCEGDGCKFCNYTGVKKASTKTAEPAAGVAPAPDKKEVVLYNQQNGSDKEYRVQMIPTGDGKWMVEALNGRRGKATNKAQSFGPMQSEQAQVKFDELVAAKTSGGYTRSLDEQPKAPGQDALQALPARGQGNGSIIQLENPIQVALYKGMLIGQMSDGAWENSSPMNHWRPMAEAEVRVGKPGMNFSPRRTYGFVNLLQYVGDEMLDLARATKAYPNADLTQLNHAIPYVVQSKPENMKDDWQKKYVDAILKATGETDINQFLAKVNGQPYGMGELRKDLRAIQNVVNGKWHQENDARFASIMKAARDRNEEMSYKGHTFKLTTWEERDRLNINLTDECCGGADVLNVWDDDARGLIEDGFIDPRKMIQSAVEYADSLGMIESRPDEDQDMGPMVEASSARSRQAAKDHEANLAKRYAGRKQAEEVPTADSILTEILTDIGQAPLVNVPGTDNQTSQPSTTPEAQNVPAPMKSEEPEQAKEQSAPEQEATPFETTAAAYDDFAPTPRTDLPGKRTYDDFAPTKREDSRPAPAPKPAPTPKKKSGSQRIADVMDLLEGGGRFGYGRHMAEAINGDLADAKSEITFNKNEMVDNSDAEQSGPSEHFAALLDDEEEWCDACQQHRPCSCDDMEADRAKEKQATDNRKCKECGKKFDDDSGNPYCGACRKAGKDKKAGHEGERHDDVPVSQGETESGPKQPASDLSGAAPEAHDAPAQVDKKTADAEPPYTPMKYYQEPSGDYLSVDPDTASYYVKIGRPGDLEGRATAIEGQIGSVCTTAMDEGFLNTCKEVPREQVPAEWLFAFGEEPDLEGAPNANGGRFEQLTEGIADAYQQDEDQANEEYNHSLDNPDDNQT
jgi:hypothetical protein